MMSIVAVGLVFKALWKWHNFRSSRTTLLYAWVLCLVGPFVSSILPARLFVDWRRGTAITSQYTKELLDVTNLEERMQQLRRGCYQVMSDEGEQDVDAAEEMITSICGVIYQRLPNGNV